MNIVIAMDSFKGSMSSLQAGQAAKAGVFSAKPDARVTVFPAADGGEGTLEALSYGKNVQNIRKKVCGPLGTPVNASYIVMGDCAYIEMAEAAGLILVAPELRDPLYTTTYGVGELIADALDRGIRRFIIGLGGSATNDAGIGMLSALGWRFLRKEAVCKTDDYARGSDVLCGAALEKICGIDERMGMVRPELAECSFMAACDVTNPLYGPEGASCVYAPQKGASPEQARSMDEWMKHFAEFVEKQKGSNYAQMPGAGAAGGMGFALLAFLHARLMPGIELVLEQTGAEKAVRSCDLVLTGEGCLDGQTLHGKTVAGVAGLAKKYRKPVYAFAGLVKPDSSVLVESGLVRKCIAITPQGQNLREAMRTEAACENMKRAVREWISDLLEENADVD